VFNDKLPTEIRYHVRLTRRGEAAASRLTLAGSVTNAPYLASIHAARQAWNDGHAIIAAAINALLKRKGSQLQIVAPKPTPRLTLLECRRRLANAFRDIPIAISNLPHCDEDTWQPWAVGYLNGREGLLIGVGCNYVPANGDEFGQIIEFLEDKPTDWEWNENLAMPIAQNEQAWRRHCEEMELRLRHTGPSLGVKPDESNVNQERISSSDPPLSELQQLAIVAMLELKAIDPNSRRPADEIAERAGGVGADAYKGPLAGLKKLGLVDAKTGRDGGSWLLPKGHDLADRLRTKLRVDDQP
jgi:hypothetical protein